MNTKPRKTLSPETREKMSKASSGRKHTPETREKMRQARLGKKHSLETRKKMSKSQSANIITPETREKMRKTMTGKKHSLETREKLRKAQLGKKHTPEACEKMSRAKKGKKHTSEARRNMSKAKKGKKLSIEHCENMSLAHQYDPMRDKGKYTIKQCIDPKGRIWEFESVSHFVKTHSELFDPQYLKNRRGIPHAVVCLNRLIHSKTLKSWKGWSIVKEGSPKPPPVSIKMLKRLNQLQKL